MSNMNRINYNGRVIKDEDLAIGSDLTNNLMLYQALISEELKPDTFTFNLVYDKGKMLFLKDSNGKYLQDSNGKFLLVKADAFDPEAFRFGDTLDYYINDGSTMVGKFYVRSVRRVAKKIYRFECMSAIGMLTYRGHNGGMYNGATLGSIVAEIMDNIPYTIDADLAKVTCTGPLPKVKAARDNLQSLLFMSGGSVKKNPNGTVNFGYIGSGSAKTIPNDRLNVGAQIAYLSPATRVEVTSHEFHALDDDEVVVLYDNTSGIAAQSLVVDFDNPCHDLVADGLTIEESNANYAIVTGVGTLTGKVYTHTTSVYAINTGSKGEPNIIQVTDNHMINPGNVANVAKRIAGYYGVAKEVSYLFRIADERPGDKVSFKDPWGDQQTGFIKDMNITLSKKLNANATIALDWTPGPFGDAYSKYRIFRQSDIRNGRLNLPADMVGSQALIVLLSGAGGGQAGYDGKNGVAPSGLANYEARTPGPGGEGGEPGQPGERGRIYSVYENALPAYFDNASIGVGGPGGTHNGELGQPGTDTTLGTYSTADGVQLIDDYTNFLTGDSFGTMNTEGERGSDGGIGAGTAATSVDTSTNGEDHVCEDETVNAGGAYANGVAYDYKQGSNSRKYRRTGGAGGGGAAHGNAGTDGYTAHDLASETEKGGSWGGDGADAVAPAKAKETQSGRGGNGGGGGGGAAQCYYHTDGSSVFSYGFNYGGEGGHGSEGGQGGDGLIIMYYNPAA